MIGRKSNTVEEILERKVVDEKGCWNYTGLKDRDGYGRVTLNLKGYRVHRLSYTHFIGEIERGKVICHSCDNPSCFNPNHLFQGTVTDNNKDKTLKGKDAKGGTHNRAWKLNDAAILDIRTSGETRKVLAARYGVIKETITKVRKFKSYTDRCVVDVAEANNNRKLSMEQARMIRQSNLSCKELSMQFLVSNLTISKIKKGLIYVE